MCTSNQPLHIQIRKPIAFIKLTGAMLVNYKAGKYHPCRKGILLLPVLVCFVCDFNELYSIFERVFFKGHKFFTASLILQKVAQVFYRFLTFICHYMVLFKTENIANILNKVLFVETQIHIQYEGIAFKIILNSFIFSTVANLSTSSIYTQGSPLVILSEMIVELYIISLILSIILFSDLILSINKSLNLILKTKPANVIKIGTLRHFRGIMNEVAENFHILYGFPILMIILVRSIFFVHGLDQFTEGLLHLFYSTERADNGFLTYFAFWALLDLICLLTIIMSCARAELEVSFYLFSKYDIL